MPWINGRFYANPRYGLGVERSRASEGGAALLDSGGEDDENADGHWITVDGRHVLIGGRQTSRNKGREPIGARIARTARGYDGSTDWAFATRKDEFGPDTNKCNKYVYDVTREAGAEALTRGNDGKMRAPLATEWADRRVPITNW